MSKDFIHLTKDLIFLAKNKRFWDQVAKEKESLKPNEVKGTKYGHPLFDGDSDPINRPHHYTQGRIESIEVIEDWKLGFCLGNAVKYICRAGKKDPNKEIEDLEKAIWYIERQVSQLITERHDNNESEP